METNNSIPAVKAFVPPNKYPYLGFKYEDLILAHLAIKCTLYKNVKDFAIKSNAEGFESLDDIVLDVDYSDGENELFLFQLKHKGTAMNQNILDSDKPNTREKDKSVKFSIDKYIKDFDIIKKRKPHVKITVVLYTNADLMLVPYHTMFTESLSASGKLYEIFKTAESGRIFKYNNNKTINVKDASLTASSINQFFENCLLFTNQGNAENTEVIISKDLENYVSKEINHIMKYFENANLKWNEWLRKKEISLMLAEHILDSHVVFSGKALNTINNRDLLIDTLNWFNIAVISEKSVEIILECIKRIVVNYYGINNLCNDQWSEDISFVKSLIEKRPSDVLKRKAVNGKLLYKDLIYSLWAQKKVPLLVSYTEVNKKQVEFVLENFTSEFTMVIIDHINCFTPPKHLRVFLDMSNIEDEDIKFRNIENIRLSYQGKDPFSLKNISNIVNKINPDLYIKFAAKEFVIGKHIGTLPNYIPRKLKVLLYGKEIFKDKTFQFITDDHDNHKFEEFLIQRKERKTNLSYCFLKELNGKYFCYASSNSIDRLDRYKINDTIDENQLLDLKLPYNIIFGNAGMGKSTLLYNIETKLPKEYWSIHLSLTEHFEYFKEDLLNDRQNFINYIINHLFTLESDNFKYFLKTLFEHNVENNKVVLFIDGFDEVDLDSQVISSIYNLLKVPIFVTTRPSKKVDLEIKLYTYSFELLEFSKECQKKFIIVNDKSGKSEARISQIVEELNSNVYISFLGVPLITKLLVDVLPKLDENANNYKLNIMFLYDAYLLNHTKHYNNADKRFIKELAFQLFFSDFDHGLFKKDKYILDCEDFKKKHTKDNILGGFTADSKPIFIHRTFAECLCSSLLITNYKEIKEFMQLYKKLYTNESLLHVRYFFDLMMCKELPLHLAVLGSDIRKVDSLLTATNLKKPDQFGRTVLHIAMSYGRRHYDVSLFEYFPHRYKLHVNIIVDQFKVDKEILEKLLETMKKMNLKCSLDSFQKKPSFYAIWSQSLDNLDLFCRYETEPQLSKSIENAAFVYSVVYFNYYNIFNCIVKTDAYKKFIVNEDIVIMAAKHNHSMRSIFENFIVDNKRKCILYVAAERNSLEIAISIVDNQIFSKNFNGGYKKRTALHFSAEGGHVRMANWLLGKNSKEQDVDINARDNEGITAIFRAVKMNHVEMVEFLIIEGADLTNKNENNDNLLHTAAFWGSVESAEKIIKANSSLIDEKDQLGETPLTLATQYDNRAMIKLLTNNGANLIVKNTRGMTLLHYAALVGNLELAEHLYKKDQSLINNRDNVGETPIFQAVASNDSNMIKWLIEKGAELVVKTNYNKYLLHLAAFMGNVDLVDQIVKRNPSLINEKNQEGKTPLHIAIQKNHADTITLLIDRQSKLTDKANNENMLHAAAYEGYVEVAEKIIEKDPTLINEKDKKGETPLILALQMERFKIMILLIDKGADLSTKFKYEYDEEDFFYNSVCNIMHATVVCNNIEIVKKVIEKNPSLINERDENGKTSLFLAIERDNVAITTVLLNNGADVRITYSYQYFGRFYRKNWTILHVAAFNGNTEISAKIIEKDSSLINEMEGEGMTPLALAVGLDITEMSEWLIENGAEITVKSKEGQNLLHSAAANGNLKIAYNIIKRCSHFINEKDNTGKTPLFLSIQDNQIDMIEFLLKEGADVTIKTFQGRNIMHLVAEYGNAETAELLLPYCSAFMNDKDNDGLMPLDVAKYREDGEYKQRIIQWFDKTIEAQSTY